MKDVEMMDSAKTWKEFKELYGFWDDEQIYTNCAMLIPVFRVEQWLEQINESLVRPLPCVRDEHGAIKKQNIKMLYAKINEELDELKSAVNGWRWYVATCDRTAEDEAVWKKDIAEEAADTITAITTMLEALGIDAEMRDEAQRRVNERNRERVRL